MKEYQMEFKYIKGDYSFIKPFTVYITNSYKLYSSLKSIGAVNFSDEINNISRSVLENGTIVDSFEVDKYLMQHNFEFMGKVFKFAILYKEDGSRYVLLYDIIENSTLYAKPSNKSEIISLFACAKENTYEGFLEYARFNELPPNKETKNAFYKDFTDSLFSRDLSMYNRDRFFNFFTVENVNRPGEYFYFLVFDKRVCITYYSDYRSIIES